MRVREIDIEKLVPYARNPRNNAHAVDKVAASLREFGWKQPIVVDAEMTVVAGHTRLLAAKKLDLKKAPIVVADDLTPEQVKAYRLADNRIAEDSTWDMEMLGLEIKELEALDLDLALTGFDDTELDRLISYGGDSERDDEVPPVEEQAVSVPGDVWLLGKHRLLCGDCTVATDVQNLLDGVAPQLVCTSPPYNQNIHKFKPSGMHAEGKRESQWVAKVGRLAYFDGMPEVEYQQWQIELVDSWKSISAPTAALFYNHKIRYRDKQIVSPFEWLSKTSWNIRQEIVWSRPGSVTQNARMFLPSDERIYWCTSGKSFVFNDSSAIKSYSSVWRVGLEANKDHAVAYPCELPRRAIESVTNVGDVVYDPFMGSGTTIVAGEKEGRPVYGIEINPLYVDVCVRRWQEYTGGEAKLMSGETFSEIENARRAA